MNLPIECKNRIFTLYKNKAENIILKIENLIDIITKKYNLKNVLIYNNMSYNLIFSAYNEKWKNVIVKIGIMKKDIDREIEFYNKYKNNSKICKIYVSDKKNRYIIMAKIEPGTKLDSLKSLKERLKIFEEIYNSINSNQEVLVNLPEYKTILNEKIDSAKEEFLESYIKKIKIYYKEIENLNMPKYILHGDLHHWNIIKSKEDWKIIDPVGYIGEKIFDVVVFLQNEFWKYGEDEDNIKTTVEQTSKQLKIDKKIIYKCLYINLTLTVIWNIEDNDSESLIRRNIKMLDIIEKKL